MAKVTVRAHATDLVSQALADMQPRLKAMTEAAIREALKPPPPGMVRLTINVTVSELLLTDELAFGAFLVSAAKKGLK